MKKCLLAVLGMIAIVSCQESLEKRLERENKEYTKKNCPQKFEVTGAYGQPVTLWLDSVVFSPATRTLSHYFRITEGFYADTQTEALLQELRNSTKFVEHRKQGYSFHYQYRYASKPDSILYEKTFTKEDY